VVLLLTIGVWLGLLWAGWTLVLAADPDAVISSATREPASGWSRVSFAGFTTFTLGVGDYIPNGRPWKILTAIASVTGLGLTTLALTYLVPVVSAVTARRSQANTIAGMGTTPQEIVISGLRDHRFPYLEHRPQALSDSLLETAERHLAYPVLHYFHSAERHVDLRTQTYLLDEAVTLLQQGVAAGIRPHPAVLDGRRHAITQLVERATDGSSVVTPPATPRLDALRRAGIPTVDDETFQRSVAGLTDHRRRVAEFASESLWPIDNEEHPMTSESSEQNRHDDSDGEDSGMQKQMNLRFGAMILTGMVVMYWVMFLGSWEWSHVRWSQSRMFMALTMGGTMGLVMLAWMLNMYRNRMANIIVVGVSLLLLAGGIALDRSQTAVDDTESMKGMIPHHSLAITRSERFDVEDVRVCELAVAISEAQRREILEMDWLVDDIAQNGPVTTAEEAGARPVPDFERPADLQCPPD